MNKNESTALIVIAVLVVAVFFGTNGFKSISGGTVGGTTTVPVGSYTGTQKINTGAGYINLNKLGSPNTTVAGVTPTAYSGTALTGQSPYATLSATLTTGPNQTSITFAPGPYVVWYHNNVNYLDTFSTVNVAPGISVTNAGTQMWNYTAPTVTAGNGTTAYPSAATALFRSVTASSTLTQPVLEIKAGSQATGDAMGSLVVVGINSIAINGGSQFNLGCPGESTAPSSMVLPTPTYVSGQNIQFGYIVPQLNHGQVLLCNPTITTTSSYGANTPISVKVYPITNYNLNGQAYMNVVVDPSTAAGTPIIAGVGSSATFNVLTS